MQTYNWQKIYSEYSPKLLGICRRYIPDLQTAEDILQDSFIAAIQNHHQLKDEKALFGWLKKIVVNNALQYLRKNKDVFITTEPSEIPDTFSEMNPTFSEEKKHIFIYDFTREELLSSIDSLPSHHKSVFNLYFLENHSHAEISTLLGISVNTSKSHLLRAKKTIQNYLMNTVSDENKPRNKKKMAQLLVIFGFGGILWAQTFKGKFSDFTIAPSKQLEIPENYNRITKSSFSASGQNGKKKIIAGSVIIIIAAASAFVFNSKNIFFVKDKSPEISDSFNEKTNDSLIENTTKKNNLKAADSESEKNSENNPTNSQESISGPQSVSQEEFKIHRKEKKIIVKDSIKEVAQKVIVVKKIIQRDTIFVER